MISNNLNAKTKGVVVIVRQPHQFKPTVTWFVSKEKIKGIK